MTFLVCYNWKILFSGGRIDFWWGENKNLVGGVYWGGGFFQVGGGDEQIFGWWGGTPPIPQ